MGEGCKPSREEYIAESEFALLGILSKEYLMIHFYLDSSDWDFQHMLCSHLNFRLHTLGAPVRYSAS